MKKEKYILLYLRTGSGHLAPAKSIADELRKNHPGIEPLLIDGFEKAPSILKLIIESGYRRLQHAAKWFYEFLYALNKIKLVAWIDASIISFFVRRYIREVIEKEEPAKILIFHFFLIKPVYDVLDKINKNVKTFTIVTDPYTAHPLWFLRKEQNFILFSQQLKEHCLSVGIDESRINVFSFILNEKFSGSISPVDKIRLKQQYALPPDKNVILILGGGDGIPKGEKIIRTLLNDSAEYELIIICGKNKSLYRNALSIKEQEGAHNLSIYGFVDFVYDLINVSDVVITKCGASTFMEIVISKKIPVVTNYIWEQEKGNKDFIVKNGMGVYVKDLNTLPSVIDEVFRNREYYEHNIGSAQLKNGTMETTSFLASG